MKLHTFIIFLLLPFFLHSQFLMKESIPLKDDITSLIITRDMKKIVVGTKNKNILSVSPQTGLIDKTTQAHSSFVFSVAYDNKKTLATAGWDNKIIFWDAMSMDKQKEISAHSDRINDLKFSPNGTFLASASSDNTIVIWKVATGEKIIEIKDHKNAVTCIAFSKDGKHIVSSGWDNIVMIHSTTTGKLEKTLSGHSKSVNSVDFSNNGKFVASGSEDNTCIVWNVETASVYTKFTYFKSAVNNVKFTSNEKMLFCTDADGNMKIFDISRKRFITQSKLHDGNIYDIFINGNSMVSSGDDQKVKFWNIGEYVYYDCVNDKLSSETELIAAKKAEESDIQYKARMKKLDFLKMKLATECLKEENEKNKAKQDVIDNELLKTYENVLLSVDKIGEYNIDKSSCEIEFQGIKYEVSMTVEDAKSLKIKASEVKVKAIKRIVGDEYEYVNLQLLHPITKKSYLLGEQINPAEDRLLKLFMSKQKQS